MSQITQFYSLPSKKNIELFLSKNVTYNIFIFDMIKRFNNSKILIKLSKTTIANIYIYSLNNGVKKNIAIVTKQESNSAINMQLKILASHQGVTQITLDSYAEKNVQKIKLNQQVDGILFGESNIRVIPSMYIETNAVIASHAVNVGNINPEQLFYLMSKGINKQKATSMIINSMFAELKNISNEHSQALYNNLIKNLSLMVK